MINCREDLFWMYLSRRSQRMEHGIKTIHALCRSIKSRPITHIGRLGICNFYVRKWKRQNER